MKLKVTRTQIAGQTEWTFELERGLSNRDLGRMAAEAERKYRMALLAIREAPVQATEIADAALEDL